MCGYISSFDRFLSLKHSLRPFFFFETRRDETRRATVKGGGKSKGERFQASIDSIIPMTFTLGNPGGRDGNPGEGEGSRGRADLCQVAGQRRVL